MKLSSKGKIILIALGFITAIFASVIITLSIAKSKADENAIATNNSAEEVETVQQVDLDDLLDAIDQLDDDVPEGHENPITETDHRNIEPAAGYLEPEVVTLHVICHSHMDAGWLYPQDWYYDMGVNYALGNVTEALLENEERKYTVGDMYYFQKWYYQQNETTREVIQDFVRNGRIEIVHGGWVSADEATTMYNDLVDNFLLGRDFTTKEFGVVPNIAWQLDPFGHAPTNAKLFADIGFDAMFFARVNLDQYRALQENESMNFLWQPEFTTEEFDENRNSAIFAHLLEDHYSPPSGIMLDNWWESFYGKDLHYDRQIRQAQIKSKILKHYAFDQLDYGGYKSKKNAMTMWGEDFAYVMAKKNFQLAEKFQETLNETYNQQLIEAKTYGWKAPDQVHIKFSTVKEYLDAIKSEMIEFNDFHGDLFPYYKVPRMVWSGYYTSDPYIKKWIRFLSSANHAFGQLNSFKVILTDDADHLNATQSILDTKAIMQHHDAVTGTHTNITGDDYQIRIHQALDMAYEQQKVDIIEQASLTGLNITGLEYCVLQNTTDGRLFCESDAKSSDLDQDYGYAIYNPSLETQNTFRVRMLADYNITFKVWDPETSQFDVVVTDVICSDPELETMCDVYGSYPMAPMTTTVFVVDHTDDFFVNHVHPKILEVEKIKGGEYTSICFRTDNDTVIIDINSTDPTDRFERQVNFTLGFYKPKTIDKYTSSGHYAFRTADKKPRYVASFDEDIEYYIGKVVQQASIPIVFWEYHDNCVTYNTELCIQKLTDDCEAQQNQQAQVCGEAKFAETNTTNWTDDAKNHLKNELIKDCKQDLELQTLCSSQALSQSIACEDEANDICPEEDFLGRVKFNVYTEDPDRTTGFDVELITPWIFISDYGKELVATWQSEVKNGVYFETDSNGMEMLNNTGNLVPGEMPMSNFKPVNSAIQICDDSTVFTITNDRPQAATSLQDGQIEFLLNRKLLFVDDGGISEPMNITGILTNEWHVDFTTKGLPASHKLISDRTLMTANVLQIFRANHSITENSNQHPKYDNFIDTRKQLVQLLKNQKVDDIVMYPFPNYGDETQALIKVRLQAVSDGNTIDHQAIAEAICRAALWAESSTTVNTTCGANSIKVRQTTLSGDQSLTESDRYKWDDRTGPWTVKSDSKLQSFDLCVTSPAAQ